MPYLHDATQEVAHAYGAKVTPDVFVLDSEDRLRYRGAPDARLRQPGRAGASGCGRPSTRCCPGRSSQRRRDQAGRLLDQVEAVAMDDYTPQQVAELIERGEIQLIDVRQPEEHDAGRIAGDRLVVLADLAGEVDSIDRDASGGVLLPQRRSLGDGDRGFPRRRVRRPQHAWRFARLARRGAAARAGRRLRGVGPPLRRCTPSRSSARPLRPARPPPHGGPGPPSARFRSR